MSRRIVIYLALVAIMGWLSSLLYALRDDSPARFVSIGCAVVITALMIAVIREEVRRP